MPCTLPGCLFLHDYGSQEDSFKKDEIVSAFSRGRVQKIIGPTNNTHWRSGNVLPPPANGSSNMSTLSKPIAKISSNQNTGNQIYGSCVGGDRGRSGALSALASWVSHVSGNLPPASNLPVSDVLPSSKLETSNGPKVIASEIVSAKLSNHDIRRSMKSEGGHEEHCNSKLELIDLVRNCIEDDCQIAASSTNEKTFYKASATQASSNHFSCLSPSRAICKDISVLSSNTSSLCSPHSGDDQTFADRDDWGKFSGLSSITTSSSVPVVSIVSASDHISVNLPGSQGSQKSISEQISKPSISPVLRGAMTSADILDYDDQQLNGLEGLCCIPSMSSLPGLPEN